MLSLPLLLTGLAGFYAKMGEIQLENSLLNDLLSFYILIGLLGIGLFLWTISKWFYYKKPIQERIYRIYHSIESSSTVPKRITDKEIKTQIIQQFLKRNGLLFQNKIEQIINTLKYESEIPVYQFRFTKIFNSLSLLLLGAFIGEALKPEPKGQNTSPNLSFDQAFDIFKSLLTIATMLWVLVWFIEMTMVKHLYGGWVNKRYKLGLIRALQEIKLNLDE